MATFTDSQGRGWDVALTYRTYRQILHELDVDLFQLLISDKAGELWQKLMMSVCLPADILTIVCRRQAEERGMAADEFADMLAGDVLGAGMEALRDAIVDFTPDPQVRAALRAMNEEAARTMKQATKQAALQVHKTSTPGSGRRPARSA